jgi:ATP-dependent Clp protease ATP-binding subunit ClpA
VVVVPRLARSQTMFERFNEDARRAVFFARLKTLDRDGDMITSEDLLSGIVMAVPDVVVRFASQRTDALTPREVVEDFMRRLEDQPTWITRASKEIPFSVALRLVLERAIQEANDLGHKTVRPEHLLLGLLRDENTEAWRTLQEAGVRLREVRRILGEDPTDGSRAE